MNTNIDESLVKKEHPLLYKEMCESIAKKNMSGGNWMYSHSVRIDNSVEPTSSLEEYLEYKKSKIGISLQYKSGRKYVQKRIDDVLPSVFVDMFTDMFYENKRQETLDKNRISNFDAILKANGHKDGFVDTSVSSPGVMSGSDLMNHMFALSSTPKTVYPTLEELKNSHRSVYDKYVSISDGTKLVCFEPGHAKCDEYGFLIKEFKAVTKRVKTNDIKFISEDGMFDTLKEDNKLYWSGGLSKAEKHFEAQPGTVFTGWNKTKSYKYTDKEIESLIKNKIFEDGGVLF